MMSEAVKELVAPEGKGTGWTGSPWRLRLRTRWNCGLYAGRPSTDPRLRSRD